MNNKRLSQGMGRILTVVGCFVLAIVGAFTQPASAQQKVEPITINYAAFIPASHHEMIEFNKGFINKAVESPKAGLRSSFVAARKPLPCSIYLR